MSHADVGVALRRQLKMKTARFAVNPSSSFFFLFLLRILDLTGVIRPLLVGHALHRYILPFNLPTSITVANRPFVAPHAQNS